MTSAPSTPNPTDAASSSPKLERPLSKYFAEYSHPTGRWPKRVCLVALGASIRQLLDDRHVKQVSPGTPQAARYWHETWVVNRAVKTLCFDVAFVLDDLRREALLDPEYGDQLRATALQGTPIITSVPYAEYPSSIAYPLLAVARLLGRPNCYLPNSIPLILAYAWAIGVEEICLYGVDYTHPDQLAGEADRGSAEYMVALVRERGMRVRVARTSTLLNTRSGFQLYGWLTPPAEYLEWMRGTMP